MSRVRVEVRRGGERGWSLLADGINTTGKSDEWASTYDSEEEAEGAVDNLAETMPEWWEGIEEWRVVEAPRPSGPTQPEEERDNVQVKLRLPPTEAKRLDRLAREWGLTRSEAVVRMMRGQL